MPQFFMGIVHRIVKEGGKIIPIGTPTYRSMPYSPTTAENTAEPTPILMSSFFRCQILSTKQPKSGRPEPTVF